MADEAAVLEAPVEATDLTEAVPTEGTEEIAEPVEAPESDETPTEGEDEAPEGEEGEQAQQAATDGRRMPDEIKKALAALKTTAPGVAGKLRDTYFAEQEYRSIFAKPADAMQAKQTIDEIGGPEGIQAITDERKEWEEIDRSYAEGSKDFVSGLAESNPDAFMKVAPHVINEFAQRAPEQYQYYANTVALNTLSGAGFDMPTLARAYEAYKTDNPQAAGVIAEVYNALAGLKSKAAEFEQKRTDPAKEQLVKDRQNFEQERRASFESGIASQAESYLGEKMQPEIDRILAGRKVDDEAMSEMKDIVNREVMKRLAAIPNFENQLEAFYRTGDAARSLSYIKTQYDRILPEAVKAKIGPLYRNFAAVPVAKKTATPITSGKLSPGSVVLKEMPDKNQVDWSKTTVADMMMGKAVLTNGKSATGWV